MRMRTTALASLVMALLVAGAHAGNAPLPAFCEPLVEHPVPARAAGGHARGLLWRVSRDGRPTSYVFGTMHVSDPRVLEVMGEVQGALAGSERFVMEVVLDLQAAATLQQAMFLTDGRTLSGLAGEALFGLTSRRLSAYGLPPEVVDAMKPWAAFTTLSMPANAAGLPLDMQLMAAAQAAGKEVSALETVAEQVAVFESLPEAEQIDMLREVVCHYDRFQDDVERMVTMYRERNLAGLLELSLRYASENRAVFLDTLLWARNRRMVERAVPLLESRPTFMAVGALHLPGPRGVLGLLEARGFRVEAVY